MSTSARVTPSLPGVRGHTLAVPRPLLVAALVLGLASTALGLRLLRHPASSLMTDPDVFLVRLLLGPGATAAVLAGLGLVGALGAVLALPGLPLARRRTALLVLALVEVAGFGVALQSVMTISLAGYLLAMVLPLGIVVLLVLVVRRYRRLRWPVLAGVLVAASALAFSWGPVLGALTGLLRQLATGFVAVGPKIGATVLTACMLGTWVLVVIRLARSDGGSAARSWVLRHRLALTLVAAAGPLPYGLIRMTWLTPWPQLAPGEALPPEIRLWGLLLGGCALLGTVLTLGLVLRWGETFPRWFPRLAGRPVPVAAAVVPGGLVAGLVCAAAVPMLRLALLPGTEDAVSAGLPWLERIEFALIFPFWLWGPALALAVWGYAQHRSVWGVAPTTGG